MIRLASLVLALASAWAVTTTAPAQQPSSTERRQSDDANAGRMLALGGAYGQQRIGCVQCHGLDGAGNSSGAFPLLAGQSAWYLYKTLHDYAAGLRPSAIMGPIAQTLTDRQMQDLAAHYSSAKVPTGETSRDADVSTLQIGGAIAASGVPAQGVPSCNGCHGADGFGAPPIYPMLAGQYAAYTRDQLLLWKSGQRGGDPMGIMEMIAKAMTDEQIEAVAHYYAAVSPSPARAPSGAASGGSSTPQGRDRPAATGPAMSGDTTGLVGLPMRANTRPPYLREPFGQRCSNGCPP